jgi:uroporphyrinogen-III synthase
MNVHKPLLNKNILITRPETQALSVINKVQQMGGKAIPFPLLEIHKREVDQDYQEVLSNLHFYDILIFTSVNGVHFFMENLPENLFPILQEKQFAVVGTKTQKALNKQGLEATFMPTEFTAPELANEIIANATKNASILHICGNLSKKSFSTKLKAAGFNVTDLVVYVTKGRQGISADFCKVLQNEAIDFITFTSGSSVNEYFTHLNECKIANPGLKTACIGPITAEEFYRRDMNPTVIASEYTIDGLLQAIISFYKEEIT